MKSKARWGGWKYQAVKTTNPIEDCYTVHEVMYTIENGKKKPWAMTENPCSPTGTTKEQLIKDIKLMLKDVQNNQVFREPKRWSRPPWQSEEKVRFTELKKEKRWKSKRLTTS